MIVETDSLNRRGILRGVQCVCGQWWPDFVRTESAMQFRSECCGALYQYTTGLGAQSTLSLISAGVGERLRSPMRREERSNNDS